MLSPRPRDWRPLLISFGFAVVLVSSLGWYYRPSGCTLEVWSSQEKFGLLRQMARDYNSTDAGQACPVSIDEVASGTAEQALAGGWQATGKARPDVWAPASSTWVELLQQQLKSKPGDVAVPEAWPNLAHSPLVIAMPEVMARVLGWPGRQLGWSDVLALQQDSKAWSSRGHPEWGSFKLGQTDPTVSTSGVHAFIGIFSAAVEVRDGTTSPEVLSSADIADPRVLGFVGQVERGVVHYTDTVSDFLSHLTNAGSLAYVSAVAMEEQEVWQYNETNPKVKLAAMYPREGTLFADHPYVVLAASWMDAQKQDAAAAFRDFLLSSKVQHEFQKRGFRDAGVPYATPDTTVIDEANGLLPSEPAVALTNPSPAVLAAIEAEWPNVH